MESQQSGNIATTPFVRLSPVSAQLTIGLRSLRELGVEPDGKRLFCGVSSNPASREIALIITGKPTPSFYCLVQYRQTFYMTCRSLWVKMPLVMPDHSDRFACKKHENGRLIIVDLTSGSA